jgi:hypothetical protein
MTIYELDPVVAQLAGDSRYFTFLTAAPGDVEVILGDGRRQLREAPERGLDLLLVDAFSSDAVPVHLLTEEAMALYFGRLAAGGVLGIHVSNRHLRLEVPALAGLAHQGAEVKICGPGPRDPESRAKGIAVSTWILAAQRGEDLRPWIEGSACWEDPEPSLQGTPWTDEYASVLPILRLRR